MRARFVLCVVMTLLLAGPLLGRAELLIVNAASSANVPAVPYLFGLSVPGITPGAILTLLGPDLTSVSGVVAADRFPLPTELAGTSVSFNGIAAPLLAVASVNGLQQINLVVPYGLPGSSPDPNCVAFRAPEEVCAGELALRVNARGVVARHVVVVADLETNPGIFTVNQSGSGAGVITHSNGSIVSELNPAQPRETVVLYATGLGPVTPPLDTGAPSVANRTVLPTTVLVDGQVVVPDFAGLAPNFAGLHQVNFRIPANTRLGDNIPVVLSVGAVPSNTVTIAVR